MNFNLLNRFFPTPPFLLRLGVGLDISDHSIKFLEIIKTKNGYQVGRHGEQFLPLGVIVRGEIKQTTEFKKILSDLKTKYNLNNVFISLPDDPAYVFNLKLPYLKPEELSEAVELQIEEHVPLPTNEVIFDFELIDINKETGEMFFGVVVLPKRVVMDYEVAFSQAGLKLLAIENQGSALARALLPSEEHHNLVIVDLGRTHTAVYWINGGVVVHSAAAPVGGEAITHNIEKALSLDFAQAEEVKMKQGLSRSEANKPVFEAIIPVVGAIRDEIQRFTLYWLGQGGSQIKPFDKIILIGGQSSLPGLAEYLTNNLNCPVELANPWARIFPAEYKPPLSLEESLRLGTALGLTLRNYT